VQNEVENLLAKRFLRSNRMGDFKPNTSVAKKSNIVRDENSGSAATESSLTEKKSNKKASSKRSTRANKLPTAAKKRTAAKTKGKSSSKAGAIEPTDEEIRIRAYFIAERRHRLELVGDADTDWLEARRQLLSELGSR
jgi:hypothetical protein